MKGNGTFLRWIAVAALLALAVPQARADSAPAQLDAKAAFAMLKTLAGEWNAKSSDGKDIVLEMTYRNASNGKVVMEVFAPNTSSEMMTLYYLQGNDLVATHYCGLGNQPHFKLDLAKSTPTELVFAFDGGTNFDPAKDGHVHDGWIGFPADGKLVFDWSFYAGGEKKTQHAFNLTRK